MSLALLFLENTWPWPPYCKQIADAFGESIFLKSILAVWRLHRIGNKNESIVCELCIMIAYTIPVWKAFSSGYYSVKWVDSWKHFFLLLEWLQQQRHAFTAHEYWRHELWIFTNLGYSTIITGPRHDKTCLWGFQHSITQTSLLSSEDYLEKLKVRL